MAQPPDDGKYSIKLVHPRHLRNRDFTPDTDHDRRQRWMNFSDRGHTPSIAERIREGHRALVYVTSPIKKFVWAVEYTGSVQNDPQLAEKLVVATDTPREWLKVLLPIRFLAVIDADSSPYAIDVLEDFVPNAFPMKYISKADYRKVFAAIKWKWKAG